MAMTLKSTGSYAPNVQFVVAVDTTDSNKVKLFSPSNLNGTEVTFAGTVSTTTWNGHTIGYFQTSSSVFLNFVAPKPTVSFSSGHYTSFFVAQELVGQAYHQGDILGPADYSRLSIRASSDVVSLSIGGAGPISGSTTFPSGKASFGVQYQYASTAGSKVYQGLESSSTLTDVSSGTLSGVADSWSLDYIGAGNSSYATQYRAAKYSLVVVLDMAMAKTDFEVLHGDPIGTLFDLPAAASFPPALRGGSRPPGSLIGPGGFGFR